MQSELHRQARGHDMIRLYDQEWDFPDWEGEPNRRYMVACSPRSGSTLLTTLLWRTGIMGAPLEYLNRQTAADLMVRMQFDTFGDYWRKIRRARTGPNGVFGFKSFIFDLEPYREDIEFRTEFRKLDKIVYLDRKDKIAGAISYVRALKTNNWYKGMYEGFTAEYDFDSIAKSFDTLRRFSEYWESVFSQLNVEPIRLTFEDLLLRQEEVIDEIVRAVVPDVAGPLHMNLAITLPEKQENADIHDWKERFLEDWGRIHGGLPPGTNESCATP